MAVTGAAEKWGGDFRDWGGRAYNVHNPNAGAVGDGVTDDRAALAAADALGIAEGRPGKTYSIGSDLTLANGWIPNGSILKPAVGVTVTINGPLYAGREQIFDLPDDAATPPVLTGWIGGLEGCAEIMVEWFGAPANYNWGTNTGTDASEAWNHAVQIVERVRAGRLTYAGRHLIDATVRITRFEFEVHGPAGNVHGWSDMGVGQPGIYSRASLAQIFEWVGTGTTSGGGGFHHCFFKGGTEGGVANAGRVLKCTHTRSGPDQPLVFKDCHASEFSVGWAEVSGGGVPTVGTMIFDNCVSDRVTETLVVSGGSAISNFVMKDGKMRENSGISCTTTGAFSGSLEIRGLLAESTDNPYDLKLGLCHAKIGPNYFENNGGVLFTASSTNTDSSVEISDQRIAGVGSTPDAILSATGLRVLASQLPPGEVVVTGQIVRASEVRGGFQVPTSITSGTGVSASLAPHWHVGNHPGTAWTSGTFAQTGTSIKTPWGSMPTDLVTTGNSTVRSVTLTVSSGAWTVVSVPLLYKDKPGGSGVPTATLGLFNASDAGMGDAALERVVDLGGGMVLAVYVIKALVASGGTVKVYVQPYQGGGSGDGCYIGQYTVMTKAVGGGTYDFIPAYVA